MSEAPLPHSMATRLAGWSARANQYPIFSRTWYAYRMRSFLWPLATLALVNLVIAAVIAPPGPGPYRLRFYSTFVAMWLVVALALGLGRGLAVLVARRHWTQRREAAGIVCALLFGILVALSLTPFVRAGGPPAEGSTQTAREIRENRDDYLVNLIVWIPIVVWLAGPIDLMAYFRQGGMLREAELQAQAARYKDERHQVEAKLSALASQVEPHFLFNTLAGVRAAMASDPARGILLIDHLIDYLHSTIPQLRSDRASTFVALGSQLDSVQAYLGIIQVRMPRLRVSVECAPGLRDAAIPPLMLISLVENAVKHGIELKKGPASIRVAAEGVVVDGAPRLELTVADDGIGFNATVGSGIGLSNIRERLKHLYEGAAALSLRTGEAGGVVASIVLPLSLITDGTS
jgi:signal transduction histidine kinase